MATKNKCLRNKTLSSEDSETMPNLPNQTEDQESIERFRNYRQEAIIALQENKEALRLKLESKFGIPSKTASDLVASMAVICTEFNQYLARESGDESGSGRQLNLPELLQNFFNYREWGLNSDDIIPSYVPEPWGFGFLNEFLVNTISWEIPFVYLSGISVEVLTIPNTDFWMDFKTCLQGTGDWNCLQSRSDANLGAKSPISHGLMSALVCLLEKMEVRYPPDDLKTLFKYIDAPRLICIFYQLIPNTEEDEFPLNGIDTDVDYDWGDFLATLGAFAGPASVNLHSKSQVEEFMAIYKGFMGTFIGYVIDEHGILRFREFRGWPRYVQYRDQFYDPGKGANRSLH